MSWEAWFSIAITSLILVTLALTSLPADMAFAGGVLLLVLPIFHGPDGWHGVLSTDEAVAGLGNAQVITIACLFVVVAGLRETGGLTTIVMRAFGQPKNTFEAQWRLMAPVAAASAFINNTPVVAILSPVVKAWAQKHRMSLSKLMIPLSFAT
ncbi:MAG: SLC13 family permease, partial [Salinibacterium sp.]|nr:SLC13 family permease [Salinibacterium sp.]